MNNKILGFALLGLAAYLYTRSTPGGDLVPPVPTPGKGLPSVPAQPGKVTTQTF